MIEVALRQAMQAYEQRTGERITYADLARRTGLALSTIEAIGSRGDYNTTLATVDRLCEALGCDVATILIRRATPTEDLSHSSMPERIEG